MVCTNDVHYLRESDAHPHDVLLCIGTGKGFNDPKRLRYDARQFFLKTAEEMAEVFKDFPDALASTMRIAERCNVTIGEGESYLPNFEVPPGFTLDDYFEHVAREGSGSGCRVSSRSRRPRAAAHDRGIRAAALVRARHDQEDEVPGVLPDRLGLHPLRARAGDSGGAGPRIGGRQPRGLLHADHRRRSDQLRPDLRTLPQPERVSMPDIDIDFCERRRGEVIDYVTRKYGRDNVAQIITFGR